MIVYDKVSRRLFLKTASGFLLALPLLPSLISRAANAQAADELALDQTPNIILIRTMYGKHQSQRFIHNVPGQPADQKWQEVLVSNGSSTKPRNAIMRVKDLADYQSGSTFHTVNDWLGTSLQEKGLLDYAIVPIGNIAFHGCDHHECGVFAASNATEDNFPVVKQSSIDVLIEERFKSLMPAHKAIRVMPAGRLSTSSGSCSYRFDTVTNKFEKLPLIDDVSKLFDLFFKAPDSNISALNKTAMDNVVNEYRKIAGQVSSAEKIILDQYSDQLHEVSQLLNQEKKSCSEISVPLTGNYEAKYLATNSLISHIISCGISKLVTYEMCHYHASEKDASAFADSHHPSGGNTLNANKDIFNRNLIQDLAVKMKNTNNGNGGNLLDDSLIFQASEDSWNHVGDIGPAFLMLGKAKGRVNAGKIYDYRIRRGAFDPNNDGDKLVYRTYNTSVSEGHGAIGWSPYNLILEGIMQVAGLKRQDYLLPGQLCYGHTAANWDGLYSGIKQKIDKFTDPTIRDELKNGYILVLRNEEDITYFEEAENFNQVTPGIFNV